MNDWLLRGDYGAAPTNYGTLIIAVLLAMAAAVVVIILSQRRPY